MRFTALSRAPGYFREPERRCNGGVAILRAAGASFGRAGPGNCYSGPTPVPGLRPCYLDAHRRGADGPAGRRGHPPHPVRLRTPDMRRGRAPAGGHHSRCGPEPCTPAFAQARVIPWCCLFPQSAVSGAVPVFVLSRDLRPRGSVRGSPGSLAGVKRRSGPSGGRRGLELRCGPTPCINSFAGAVRPAPAALDLRAIGVDAVTGPVAVGEQDGDV